MLYISTQLEPDQSHLPIGWADLILGAEET